MNVNLFLNAFYFFPPLLATLQINKSIKFSSIVWCNHLPFLVWATRVFIPRQNALETA